MNLILVRNKIMLFSNKKLCRIVRPNMVETTALGAAILAGIGAGLIDINDVDASHVTKFSPMIGEDGKRSYVSLYLLVIIYETEENNKV